MSFGRLQQVSKALVYMTIRDPKSLRYFWPWARTLGKRPSPLKDGVPWITFEARKWLDGFLRPETRVFEYGSGGSTLYFCRHTHHLISVEYDEEWFTQVQGLLKARKLDDRCEYRLVKARTVREDEPAPTDEVNYRSHRSKFLGLDFGDYVRTIDEYPDESFDLIVVDARARNACVRHAIPKVKPGGYLMLDNADRPDYAPAVRMLSQFRPLKFYGLGPYGAGPRGTYFWQIGGEAR